MVENDFGRNLRLALLVRGKTPNELAEHLGVSRMAVHKFTSGKMMPSSARLMQIASFADVSIDYLLGGDDVSGQFDDILRNVPPRKTARQLYLEQEAARK